MRWAMELLASTDEALWAVEIVGNGLKDTEAACGEVQSPFWAFWLQGMYNNHCTGSGHLGSLGCCSWGKRKITSSFTEFPIGFLIHRVSHLFNFARHH